jgi:hypothetical protein
MTEAFGKHPKANFSNRLGEPVLNMSDRVLKPHGDALIKSPKTSVSRNWRWPWTFAWCSLLKELAHGNGRETAPSRRDIRGLIEA